MTFVVLACRRVAIGCDLAHLVDFENRLWHSFEHGAQLHSSAAQTERSTTTLLQHMRTNNMRRSMHAFRDVHTAVMRILLSYWRWKQRWRMHATACCMRQLAKNTRWPHCDFGEAACQCVNSVEIIFRLALLRSEL